MSEKNASVSLKRQLKPRIVSLFAYWVTRCLAATVRLKIVGEDNIAALQSTGRGVILVTWHGRTLLPIARFRGRGYWAFISTSRDGDYQDQIFHRYGWNTLRGSTSARGAVQSALTMVKHLKAGATLAHTPDGPRGPHGQVHAGAIFLAQKSGCAIVPAGISASPRKLLPTWDQYLVPHFFARAMWIYGEPIYIPADANEEAQAQWAVRVGEAINALEAEAEKATGASPHAPSKDMSECRPA